MSDESIITLVTLIIGFLGMWVKLHYGEKKVEKKVDATAQKVEANTEITKKIDGQTNGGLDDRFADHAARISTLEAKVSGVEIKLDLVGKDVSTLSKNIDATRHEMRGHFGAVTQALNSMNIINAQKLPPRNNETP